MAWRLEKAVEHGEIDNSVAGTTTGRIWLRGMDEPLLLSLDGDCWRDLAGARLQFTNPAPQDGVSLASLDPDQVGVVGDMTAARRVCYSARRGGGQVSWCNALYLEWFSEANGRVLIDSTSFKLRISEHGWRMDEDEEEAQKLANLQAMREFLARMTGRKEGGGDDDDGLFGEPGWETMFKKSDRVSRAFGEVLEKYGDDPESERKEAFVMGWDRKLEALAEREEAFNMRFPMPEDTPKDGNDDGEEEDDDEAGDDWARLMDICADDFDDDDFYADEEPIVEKSRELCLRAMDLLDHEAEPGTSAYQVTSGLLEVSSKLAGALEGRDDDDGGASLVLALLKRCLGIINKTLGAMQMQVKAEEDADHRNALEHLVAETFSLRDDIVELRREIRNEM